MAQVIVFYIGLFLPLLLLVFICLCLPFALLFLHLFSPKPGAKPEQIAQLPTRTFRADPAVAADDAPTCSICMAAYEDGEQLRVLPCAHEFHLECGDRWLQINSTCPLCRKPLNGQAEQEQPADEQV